MISSFSLMQLGVDEKIDPLAVIQAHSNPYSSFSLSFCPLCIRRGFDENFARGRAEHSPDQAPVRLHSGPCGPFLCYSLRRALLFSRRM